MKILLVLACVLLLSCTDENLNDIALVTDTVYIEQGWKQMYSYPEIPKYKKRNGEIVEENYFDENNLIIYRRIKYDFTDDYRYYSFGDNWVTYKSIERVRDTAKFIQLTDEYDFYYIDIYYYTDTIFY